MLKINEVAKLTGISVRTLHYYDTIALLKPSMVSDAGYRLYDGKALERLQQILFLRELDFPLGSIKEILSDPNYDRATALTRQRELLMQKRQHIDTLICLLDSSIKGENDMSFNEFDKSEMEKAKKKYAAEVKERWGKTAAYAQSEEKAKSYDSARWQKLSDEGEAIMREFAANRTLSPQSDKAQELVCKWQDYITNSFYDCTKEILSGLGQMYVADERFTANIDKNGDGTAAFIAAAIEAYCAV